MNTNKTILLPIAVALFLSITVLGFVLKTQTKTKVKELFIMNKELQEENYYMAEFEFKMLGLSYYINKGDYYTGIKKLNQLHRQMKSRTGLVRMPEFKSKEEEMEFYLSLQNPLTGAFMDDSFPYCTFTGPTGNILEHLDALAAETGRPLKLKYPLNYLDEINTPEKLMAYFNDVSTVGWIASKFPQTTFHNARDVLSLIFENSVIEKHNLYHITPELKEAILQWFYDWQDPETGLWGPKSVKGKLMKRDLNNTASIMKSFVDRDGNNIYKEYPLRYKDELCNSFLDEAFKSVPGDDNPEEWHEWNLKIPKTIRSFTRYLWNGISGATKNSVKELIEFYITTTFEKFYIYEEGAFSYYPFAKHATIDGAGHFLIFREIGAFSGQIQRLLWGDPDKTIINLGVLEVPELKENDLGIITNPIEVNSLRIYQANADLNNLTSDVTAVFYPYRKSIPDIMDITPKLTHWLDTTDQSVGNWTSKDVVAKEIESFKIDEVPVYENGLPIETANQMLRSYRKLMIVGFDILQIPRYKITYLYSQGKL